MYASTRSNLRILLCMMQNWNFQKAFREHEHTPRLSKTGNAGCCKLLFKMVLLKLVFWTNITLKSLIKPLQIIIMLWLRILFFLNNILILDIQIYSTGISNTEVSQFPPPPSWWSDQSLCRWKCADFVVFYIVPFLQFLHDTVFPAGSGTPTWSGTGPLHTTHQQDGKIRALKK